MIQIFFFLSLGNDRCGGSCARLSRVNPSLEPRNGTWLRPASRLDYQYYNYIYIHTYK